MAWGMAVMLADVPLSDLPAYDVLSEYIPGRFWGSLALLFGLAQVLAAVGGQWFAREVRWLRWSIAWLMLLWWKVLTVALLSSGQVVPGAWVYCTIAVICNIPSILMHIPMPHRRHAV